MNIARLSVNNPVTVNTAMVTIVVLGIISLITLPREYLPDLALNMAAIVTIYPGTSPEEIETLITIPIEDEIKDIDYIDVLMSKSSEGQSTIFLQFEDIPLSEFRRVMQDLRSAVDRVSGLPADAEQPFVSEFDSGQLLPALQVTITGDIPESMLKEFADELRDRLLEIRHIGKLEMTGSRERQLWVKVDPDRLYSYDMSIDHIAHALRATNFNMPGGRIDVGTAEYLIRTVGEYSSPMALSEVIVRSSPDGKHVKIGHLATIEDTFERPRTLSFFNGKPGISFNISKKREGSTIQIVEQIKAIAHEFEDTRLPANCRVLITNDSSIQIRDAIGKLTNNAFWGTLFVAVVLCLFVGWRNAMFAGIGIPVAIMCTFIFMDWAGYSINISSLFALMIVIGIIVDDAIIVIENCHRYMQKGMKASEAAIRGTTEVMGPVFTASLTTMAAFMPLMLMPGVIGKFMRVVPIVVCLAIIASLLEVFLILPSHIADWSRTGKVNQLRERIMERLRNLYTWQLTFVLRRRFVFVPVVFATFLGSLALVAFEVIDVDMFATEEIAQFNVNVHMPEGSNLTTTTATLREIEHGIRQTLPEHELENIVINAGFMILEDEWVWATDAGHVMVDLVESDLRRRSIDQIISACRENLQIISGPSNIDFRKLRAGPPVARDVEVRVVGRYLPLIRGAADEIKQYLSRIPGVYDISDDLSFGKMELKIHIDEEKAALYGLTMMQIAVAIRNAYEGSSATVLRDGDDEIDIVVKFDPEKLRNIDDILNLQIQTPLGIQIPFKNLGTVSLEPGYSKIKRFNRERACTITANVDPRLNTKTRVVRELEQYAPDIVKRYPTCRVSFEGAFKQLYDAFSSLLQLFLLGIFLIYVILGAQFKSYAQPFIILLTVPFAFIGAIIALIATNNPFSIVVLYGFVGLAGIAVNDAIVMISFINNERRRGVHQWRSIISAGRLRLRPIILTSVTTMFGVFPLAIGLGGTSKIWAPMAHTLLWGLGFATFLTLFIMPSMYAIIVDDLPKAWKKMLDSLRTRPNAGTHIVA